MTHDPDTPPFPAYAGDEPFVFVCYAHANRAEVYAELIQLRESRVRLWYDEGIAPGTEWSEELANAIRTCTKFLYFVSPASVTTRNCRDEVQFALKHHKPLIAVHLYETALPGGLDLVIGSTQGILKYRLTAADYQRKLLTSLELRGTLSPDSVELDGLQARPTNERIKARRLWRWSAAALMTFGVVILWYRFFALPTTPTVVDYTQLTTSQVLFSPYLSPQRLATDGARIYFNEWRDGEFVPRQVSARGGDAVPVAIPPQLPQLIAGTTPDRTELLVGSRGDAPWWVWALEGTSPRRLGALEGHDLSWSPDGTRLVNLQGDDIYVANADGSEPTKIYSAARPTWAQFSPDGGRIRFTNGDFDELWEIAADGADPHPLLPDAGFLHTCCGSWSADGRHYVFQGTRNNQNHLWVLDEVHSPFGVRSSEPHQLTTGAMNFIRPLIGVDGKRLYAVSWHLRGEVMRHDATKGQFVPHFGSRSVEWLAYSRDGNRVAYITYPDADLWASDADGTHAIQLTHAPMQPVNPTWAPGGDVIAFSATHPGQDAWIYLVDANGSSAPRRLDGRDQPEWGQTWSADGSRLAFDTTHGIRLIDAGGSQEVAVAGADTFSRPSWSPDGEYLTALAGEPRRIMLYSFASSRWEELASAPDAMRQRWSPDGQSVVYVTDDPASDVYRIHIADRRIEHILSLKNERWVYGAAGIWVGFAPDGSILYLHNTSVHHIYALDWDA